MDPIAQDATKQANLSFHVLALLTVLGVLARG
jgi:hypothetical protein